MALEDNNGQKGRQGFPTKDIPPLNVAKIPREANARPRPLAMNSEDKEVSSEDSQINKKTRKDRKLDEALKGTFPASDPAQQP